MLDQNTDRMWYVIGAVIVGAAIIFLANGTLPSLFASVTDSFNESAENATHVIDEAVSPPNINLIPNSDEIRVWAYTGNVETVPRTFIDGWTGIPLPTVSYEYGSGVIIDVLPDTTYTQSLYVRTDADEIVDPAITFFWSGYTEGDAHHRVPTVIEHVEGDLYRIIGTGSTRSGQTKMRVPNVYMTFDGGTYAEFGQYKVERGSTVTKWVK